jgi:hypothetical protein
MIEQLEDGNFILYAARHYDNPHCFDTSEFYEDLNRFKYIKRLINRYAEEQDLKERLIINHIIVIGNVFGVEAAVRMLFFKTDKEHYPILKSFLTFLNYLPELIYNVGPSNRTIATADIPTDPKVDEALRSI